MRVAVTLLLTALAMSGCGGGPHEALAAKPDVDGCAGSWLRPKQANGPQVRAATLCLINAERARHQLAPLTENGALDRAAELHSLDMAKRDFFEHQNPDGEQPDARIVHQGYPPILVGENLAWGETVKSTPANIVSMWMKSPGHRANILEAGLPRDRHRHGLRRAGAAARAQAGRDLHDDVRGRRALDEHDPVSLQWMLEVRELARRYGDVVALDGLSFTVEPGQLFGFVGPNGAGKTTTMRIILGVLEPDAGEVRWRGAPVDLATRARFGYMPEERGLYPKMRVRDQLAYFASLHGLGAGEAAAAADLWLERLGLQERAGDRVETLSLGNQQRVQLGVALVHGPELLVLDEPFSGLDPVGVDVLSGVLQGLAGEGVPVLFSSHQLELVERLCESVAIVNGGRLVASGRVDDLRSQGARAVTVRVAVTRRRRRAGSRACRAPRWSTAGPTACSSRCATAPGPRRCSTPPAAPGRSRTSRSSGRR